eukprot:15344169-Ditylum_brightwellii.AAC.2
MKVVVCHSYAKKEVTKDIFSVLLWPRTKDNKKKQDTGQFDIKIPQSGWLADPKHRTKAAAKHFLELLNKRKITQA